MSKQTKATENEAFEEQEKVTADESQEAPFEVSNESDLYEESQDNGIFAFLYATDGPFAFLNRSFPTWSGQKAMGLAIMLVAAIVLVISALFNLIYKKPETPSGPSVTYNYTSSSDAVSYSDTVGGVTYSTASSDSKNKG